MAWTALLVIGEIVCSATVMAIMLRHNWRLRKAFRSSQVSTKGRAGVSQVIHASNYKKIVIRVGKTHFCPSPLLPKNSVALYPIASCCVNLLSVVTALHSTVNDGIKDRTVSLSEAYTF
jgi:hypothetical protein